MNQQSRTGKEPDQEEIAAGVASLEGYLMVDAARREAHERGTAFANSMPWLGTTEREEVVRLYVTQDITRTRTIWETIDRRGRELNDEYNARYEELRQRVRCRTVAGWLLSTAITGTVCAFTL